MKKQPRSRQPVPRQRLSRRDFVGSAATVTLGAALGGHAAQSATEASAVSAGLSTAVQMQFMLPAQLESVIRDCPVVYVPLGLIEWHGQHLPLGNDALKAHAILVKAAEQFGGAVYPPVYFHEGFPREAMITVLTELFKRLKQTGFRVLLGVSGHNVQGQIDMLNEALKPVIADGATAGMGLWEITLSRGPESNTDHAAKWENSNMMHFYPDLVDLSALGEGPLALDMKPPDGIGGQDPRKFASPELGRRNAELAATALGNKARQLLQALPERPPGAQAPKIIPGEWWMI